MGFDASSVRFSIAILFALGGWATPVHLTDQIPLAVALPPPQLVDPTVTVYYRDAHPYVNWTLQQLTDALPELKGLEPAASQEELPAILRKTGANVEAFFHDFVNTTSLEQIHEVAPRHERNVDYWNTPESTNQKFYYLTLADSKGNARTLKEYRTDLQGNPVQNDGAPPGFMLTRGFASLQVYLHPSHQTESTFRLLGQQSIDGRPCKVVAFAQRPGWTAPMSDFASGTMSFPILEQGIVWIDPADYEILRMRTDLLAPQPQIELQRSTSDIRFGPVTFKESNRTLWLPSEVEVDVEYRRQTFRNLHRYSDYRLFNVEADEVHHLIHPSPQDSEKPQ
jgi:hypothetical protein